MPLISSYFFFFYKFNSLQKILDQESCINCHTCQRETYLFTFAVSNLLSDVCNTSRGRGGISQMYRGDTLQRLL